LTKRRIEKIKKIKIKINIEKENKTLTSWAIVVEGQRFEVNVRFMSNFPHTKHERWEVPCHSLNKQQQG
jgi:hypothetical protein